MPIIPLIALLLSALLFILPFAKPKPQYDAIPKTRTLLGLLVESILGVTRQPMGSLVIGLSALSNALPPLIIYQSIQIAPRNPAITGLILIESLVCLAGAAGTFLFIALTYVSFGWGASRSGKTTLTGYAITALALLAILLGIITTIFPTWLSRLAS